MAKKRAKDSKITIDFEPKLCEDTQYKPACFGSWVEYCTPELCGKECYEACKRRKK